MTLRVDVLTLFPDAIANYASTSVLGRASERDVWHFHLYDLRDATDDAHRTVDDTPFGGGAGMVLRAEPILHTLEQHPEIARPLIALTPSGRPFTQEVARELATLEGFSLLCGRYEGIDQRALDLAVDDEISLGDFVLAGGELAALCVIEAVVRLLTGGAGQRRERARGVLQRRTARVPALHPAGRGARRRGARDPAIGRPRANRALASRPGAATNDRTSSRPDRRARRLERRGRRHTGRIPGVG